ncbi:GTA-like baseplate hub protein [Pseudanabaena phage Pan1]|nr:GTA-like baseplate hub protein [Pseudanabaena phage Pan1]
MIWFTLALFVVSFLITALLAPKPELENARADSLDNVDFPRATEDAPIPFILGKVRMNAPNTTWYGDFESVPIRQKVKTGLFSKTWITVGYQYYLGLDLAVGMGPGMVLEKIIIDEKDVWTGTSSSTVPTSGTIDSPSLFGGYKEGGGWTGAFTFYPGSFTQPVDSYVEGQVGAGNVPAYRGLSHIVFNKNYIGESAQLRKISFVLSRYTNSIGAPNSGRIGPNDVNPMEALYQIMTDKWSGLGIDASAIDLVSFQAAATTLHAEGNGCSILITAGTSGETVIKEILRQVDGILYQDPETGRVTVKLIRFDYDPDDLPIYDESDVVAVRNFSKTSWEDVVAQVKVSFKQLEKESDAVAIAQDMAVAAMIGRLKTATQSFPFCYNPTLAAALAQRSLSQSSVPLFRITLEMNRNAFALRPGSVFRFDWPEYGIANAVMRVQKHDLGALLDNKIVIECIQDSFASSQVVLSEPVGSGWQTPTTQPSDIVTQDVIEMPRFIASRLELPVVDGKEEIIPLFLKPQVSSTGFNMFAGITTGVLDTLRVEEIEYPATGTLQAAYNASTGFSSGFDATGFVVQNVVGLFEAGTTAEVRAADGGLLWVNGEWMSYGGVVGTGTTVTLTNIRRGLFGSRPLDHALGTRVWAVEPQLYGEGLLGSDLNEGATVFWKGLDRVGRVVQDLSEVTQQSKTLTIEGNRPARPRYLEVAGARTLNVTTAVNRALTWRPSNRNHTQVTFEDDASQTPAETETYNVQVLFNGVVQPGLGTTGVVGSTFTIPFSTLPSPTTVANAEIRVTAVRSSDARTSRTYASFPFTVNIP